MVVSEYIDSSGVIELTVEYLGYRDAVDELTRYLVYKRFKVVKGAEREVLPSLSQQKCQSPPLLVTEYCLP